MSQTSPVSPPAMNWLAFDTSTEVLSVAVQHGERIWHRQGPGGPEASSTLIPCVLELMQEAGLGLRALQAIVFGRGPGSFTGLRTACAVAQGLAQGADVPVLALDTLQALAQSQQSELGPSGRVLAVLDARMGQLYAAAYHWQEHQWHVVQAPGLFDPKALRLPEGWQEDPSVVIAGSPVPDHAETLSQALGRPWQCRPASPSALALLALAPAAWMAGLATPARHALPLYVRDKVAQTTAERQALQRDKA